MESEKREVGTVQRAARQRSASVRGETRSQKAIRDVCKGCEAVRRRARDSGNNNKGHNLSNLDDWRRKRCRDKSRRKLLVAAAPGAEDNRVGERSPADDGQVSFAGGPVA